MEELRQTQFGNLVGKCVPALVHRLALDPGERRLQHMHVRIGSQRKDPRHCFLEAAQRMRPVLDQVVANRLGKGRNQNAIRVGCECDGKPEQSKRVVIQIEFTTDRCAVRRNVRPEETLAAVALRDEKIQAVFEGIRRSVPTENPPRRKRINLARRYPDAPHAVDGASVLADLFEEAAAHAVRIDLPP